MLLHPAAIRESMTAVLPWKWLAMAQTANPPDMSPIASQTNR